MEIEQAEETSGDLGRARCRVCGAIWWTNPDQSALLADLLAHDATHTGRPETGTAPSSATPDISTR